MNHALQRHDAGARAPAFLGRPFRALISEAGPNAEKRFIEFFTANHEVPNLVGLRDRALLGVMVFSFARVSAVTGMKVSDFYQNGRRSWLPSHAPSYVGDPSE